METLSHLASHPSLPFRVDQTACFHSHQSFCLLPTKYTVMHTLCICIPLPDRLCAFLPLCVSACCSCVRVHRSCSSCLLRHSHWPEASLVDRAGWTGRTRYWPVSFSLVLGLQAYPAIPSTSLKNRDSRQGVTACAFSPSTW